MSAINGLIESLRELMKKPSCDWSQTDKQGCMKSIGELHRLSLASNENRIALMFNTHTLSILCELSRSSLNERAPWKDSALGILSCLATELDEIREVIVDHVPTMNIILDALKCLDREAATFLQNMSMTSEENIKLKLLNYQNIAGDGFLTTIGNLLLCPDAACRMKAATAAKNLSYNSADCSVLLGLSEKVIEGLASCISAGETQEDTRLKACEAVENICFNSSVARDSVGLSATTLSILVETAQPNSRDPLQILAKSAMAALTNILVTEANCICLSEIPTSLGTLVDAIESGTNDVRRAVAASLANLSSSTQIIVEKMANTPHIFAALRLAAVCNDQLCQNAALFTLKNLSTCPSASELQAVPENMTNIYRSLLHTLNSDSDAVRREAFSTAHCWTVLLLPNQFATVPPPKELCDLALSLLHVLQPDADPTHLTEITEVPLYILFSLFPSSAHSFPPSPVSRLSFLSFLLARFRKRARGKRGTFSSRGWVRLSSKVF